MLGERLVLTHQTAKPPAAESFAYPPRHCGPTHSDFLTLVTFELVLYSGALLVITLRPTGKQIRG